jgi:hypothetical protein
MSEHPETSVFVGFTRQNFRYCFYRLRTGQLRDVSSEQPNGSQPGIIFFFGTAWGTLYGLGDVVS